jgi:hypothetical protein
MLDVLSFAEIDDLQAELIPARTVMSLFGLNGDPAPPASGGAAAPGPVVVSDGPGDSTVIADTCSAAGAGSLTCIPAAIVNNHG